MLNRRQFLKKSILGGGALLAAYPFLIERYIVEVNLYQIPVPHLPHNFVNFRIIHLSDLHYGFLVPKIFIESVIAKANALNGDIIVCTGDYTYEHNSTLQTNIVFPIMGRLKAKAGVYSVLGNHDHWADFDKSIEWLEKFKQNIRHKAISIEKNGERIWIGGAGDLWEDRVGINRLFAKVPSLECRIVLAHNPDTADLSFKTRIDLMLCGHTHGGQVNIPFIGAPVLPVKNKKYSSGFIRTANTNLFITKGIGWTILPVRLNCFPEISVLNLIQEKN